MKRGPWAPRGGLAVLVLFTTALPLLAQNQREKAAGKGIEHRLIQRTFRVPEPEEVAEALSLTEDQQGRLRELYDEFEGRLAELRGRERKEKARVIEERLRSIREDFLERALSILTDEQRRKARRIRGLRGRRRDSLFDPERLKSDLALTEEQYVLLKEKVLHGIFYDVLELRRLFSHDRRRLREEIRALFEEILQDIRAVLTDEQKKKLDEITRKQRRRR